MDQVYKRNRIETKYILNEEEYNQMKEAVAKHLPRFSYEGDTSPKYTDVTSTYLDSYDLVCFKRHIDDADQRSKIRLRKYAENGKPSGEYFVEIKEKKEDHDSKSRLQISPSQYSSLQRGEEFAITPFNRQKNEQVEASDQRAIQTRLNTLVRGNKMKAVLQIKYKREAYQKGDLRVTFDCDIKYTKKPAFPDAGEAQRIKDRVDWGITKDFADSYKDDYYVMEVKHVTDKENPKWLNSLIDKLDLKALRFSKYVLSCTNLIRKTLKGN